MEIILRHLPPNTRVGVMAESDFHVVEIATSRRSLTELVVVDTREGAPFDHAVRQFIRLFMRLAPSAVLANTCIAARILAAARHWLPTLPERSFLYVRDFLWLDTERLLRSLAGATVLVPTVAVLEKPGYLDGIIAPVGPLRAAVVPDMVELPPDAPSEPAPDAPLLHLATVNDWKGHRHLINAMASLRDAGIDWHAHSYGYRPCADVLRTFQEQIADLNLSDRFVLHDYVADPSPLYRDCSCVAVTSVSHSGGPETFGRTVIEAWAHGRAVVAFAAGGPAKLINHMVDGILVPEGDEQALAEALALVRRDADLRRRLGRNGYAKVQAEFAAERVVGRLLEVLSTSPRVHSTSQCLRQGPVCAGAAPPDLDTRSRLLAWLGIGSTFVPGSSRRLLKPVWFALCRQHERLRRRCAPKATTDRP
ncbi:glycosyltransferase [Xanthobacteraceae bacterium Astr-EGSB]|uniref:glycosyltransferase n=1 Tax=Astrobacterium formosum TaxID=3069710 RepID=UPI0027B233E4|nr:glycosyltransferase [Xanthobacteraceae bacterium Astr-EGSB]